MKKVIAIVAVVVVAFVGLTSYNGTTEKKNGGDRLLAELKSGGNQLNDPKTGNGGTKKVD